jgi:cytochrome c2
VSLVVWHGLAIVALVCLPAIKFGEPWWAISRRQWIPASILIGAYLLSAVLVARFVRETGRRAAGQALLTTLGVFALCLFVLLSFRIETPRYLLLPTFVAAAVLIPGAQLGWRTRRVGCLTPFLASLVALLFMVRAVAFQPVGEPKREQWFLKTAFYGLQVTAFERMIPMPATRGGGFARLGSRLLLGTGDGHLYLLDVPRGESSVRAIELPTVVPANREAFAAAFGGSARAPRRAIEWTEQGPPRVQTWRFRVADIAVQERAGRARLYASHHYWREAEACFVVRVSWIEADATDLVDSLRTAQWQTLFESAPCVPLSGERRKRGKNPFKGEEIGGRMAFLDDNTLLLTVGDHGFQGIDSLDTFAQDPSTDYGKTLRIDLTSGATEVFTLGHRDAQGLYIARDGRIWLTEHGPQGGDELNLLVRGANYGWPLVTYGTDYGAFAWPLSERQNRHEGFRQPVFAWTPSIGISNLIQITGNALPLWRDDLLVGSLATRSLYRLVVDDDRVVVTEPIALGRRVRDLIELSDGRLLVWTDDAALLLIERAESLDGAATFALKCLGCHQAIDGMTHRIGPDLYGVIGRRIGSVPGYDEFSVALRAHPGRWTRELLDAFLRDPHLFAPGTTMSFDGIADAREREQLIDYLEALPKR